jgi:cob(I)alamin adenosyltransferase
MAKIYTKTGDKGSTSLVDGKRISKSDIRLEAYGTLDELNSHIGLAVEYLKAQEHLLKSLIDFLFSIQNELFNLGSRLAVESSEVLSHLPLITEEMIQTIELRIDLMESQLAPLKEFILPGGSIPSAQLHVARTVCRRAERHCNQIPGDLQLEPLALPYLNRLSDFLFVASRFVNAQLNQTEIKWRK